MAQEEISFENRIRFETEYMDLLKQEHGLLKKKAAALNKPVMSDDGKLERIDYLKRAMKLQIEIASKEKFIEGLKKHMKKES